MNDRASKAAVCCVSIIAAFGLTLHILWGVALLAQNGDWGYTVIALAAFVGAWMYLGLHLIFLPSKTGFRFDEAMPYFMRVMLSFCVPSATTMGMLLSSGLLDLPTLFMMLWGLLLIIVVPVTILACLWMRSRSAESDVQYSQVD